MLLSIPSILDSLTPTTEQFEATQVEVSLVDEACSIHVISSESCVESVVFVPNENRNLLGLITLNRNAPSKRGQAVYPTKVKTTKLTTAIPCSSVAPSVHKTESSKAPPASSRLKSGRRLSKESKPLTRGRETQSCPPVTLRCRDDQPSSTAPRSPRTKSKARTAASAAKRENSCPPELLGGRGDSGKSRGNDGATTATSTGNRKRKVRRHPAESPNRRANKPDLVSQTSKRIIGSYRGGAGGSDGCVGGAFFRSTARNKRNRIIPEVAV